RLSRQKEQEYQSIRELDQELVNTQRLISLADQEIQLRDRELARLKALPAGFASQSEMDAASQSRLQSMNAKTTLDNQVAAMRQRRGRLEAAEALVETQLEMARTNLERTE